MNQYSPRAKPASEAGETSDLAGDLLAVLTTLTFLLRREAASASPLSLSQAQVLRVLQDCKSRSVTELASDLWSSQPSVTALLDRMERDGLVARRESQLDRRRVEVVATDQGRRLLGVVADSRRDALALRVAVLDGAERGALAQALPALERLVAIWRAADPAVGAAGERQ